MTSSGEIASGELWGHHWMPPEIQLDVLMPNGLLICCKAFRETTMFDLKKQLWVEAKKLPLFDLLSAQKYYIFAGVTSEKYALEDFYDESRRLCDLRLFHPVLCIKQPEGNLDEKLLDYEIGQVIGKPLSGLDGLKDAEQVQYRISLLGTCKLAVQSRSKAWMGSDYYALPIDHADGDSCNPSRHCEPVADCVATLSVAGDKSNVSHDNGCSDLSRSSTITEICVSVWSNPVSSESHKCTVKMSPTSTLSDVIRTALLQKSRKLSVPISETCSYVSEVIDRFVVKVSGRNLYLFGHYPLISYSYIQSCVSQNKFPDLMLMLREEVLSSVPTRPLIPPSYVRRHGPHIPDPRQDSGPESVWGVRSNPNDYHTLWELEDTFRLRIRSASYVSTMDADFISVEVGIYHGLTELQQQSTSLVPVSSPVWNEDLEFPSLFYKDIPAAAQLCFALCAVKQRKQRRECFPLAWGNCRIIDHSWCLVQGRLGLHLWPYAKNVLYTNNTAANPLGRNGPNPNPESPCLYVEFSKFDRPVIFPPYSQICSFIDFQRKWNLGSAPKSLEDVSSDDIQRFNRIVDRDPLHYMDEQEKEFMWSMRDYCKTTPNCLPRLLDSVRWDRREEAGEVYIILESWSDVIPTVGLELLDIKYPDAQIRQFALRSLDKSLSDEQLLLYLICLIQVLKYEPHYDNCLSHFLVRRALLNREIGQAFFWIVRSEVAHNPSDLRFAFLLEAFCRSCSGYLSIVSRQVDAIKRLEVINAQLKDGKDDSQKALLDKIMNEGIGHLQDMESPLDSRDQMSSLVLDKCRLVNSAKRPIWLVWNNPDPLARLYAKTHQIIFKEGDDLRQDMLIMHVMRIMDSIWKQEGLDFRLTLYNCMSMGLNYGMIEVVKDSKTVMEIQTMEGKIEALKGNTGALFRWLKELNPSGTAFDTMVQNFTLSCAGYCVATFVLGIKDRHPSNIMVTEDGHIFHIDFGHFLGHYKKKFGISRERVPFVLTEDFLRVIAKGADNPRRTKEFSEFQTLCESAFLCLHRHANLFVSLFTMMLCMGIPELQHVEDIAYLRQTLAVEARTESEALAYFRQQLKEANERAWTTRVDGFFHLVAHM